MHIFYGAYVQSPCGLHSDEQVGIVRNFTSDDDLLLITAGQAAYCKRFTVIRTDIILF